jgi:transcriptional regulator with XRE-family HTH domain
MSKLARIVTNRVKFLRTEKKLTQEALAARTGYSIQYVSKIENHPSNISLEVLERFAEGLEVDPTSLISDREVVQLGRPNIKRELLKAIRTLERINDQILD